MSLFGDLRVTGDLFLKTKVRCSGVFLSSHTIQSLLNSKFTESKLFHSLVFLRLVPHGLERQPDVRSEYCWLDCSLCMVQQSATRCVCICITACSTQHTHTHTIALLASLPVGSLQVFYDTYKPGGNTSIWSCFLNWEESADLVSTSHTQLAHEFNENV